MIQELKIHLINYKITEKLLLSKGAKFLNETSFIDTYFYQPKGKVLKIVEKSDGDFINSFQSKKGMFKILEDKKITNAPKLKKKYAQKLGIKSILSGKRKYYKYEGKLIIFNLIDKVGSFLILTGDNPNKDFIRKNLEIENPDYITVSFDELL